MAMSFGAQSVNIVAHSKGGISAREWLGGYSDPALRYLLPIAVPETSVRVVSFTTLSSPHEGTAIADMATVGYDTMTADQQEGYSFPITTIAGGRWALTIALQL